MIVCIRKRGIVLVLIWDVYRPSWFTIKNVVVSIRVVFKLAFSNRISYLSILLCLHKILSILTGFVLPVHDVVTVTAACDFSALVFTPPNLFSTIVQFFIIFHKFPSFHVSVKRCMTSALKMLLLVSHLLRSDLLVVRSEIFFKSFGVRQIVRRIYNRCVNLRHALYIVVDSDSFSIVALCFDN